jgi:hypothetical protein
VADPPKNVMQRVEFEQKSCKHLRERKKTPACNYMEYAVSSIKNSYTAFTP